MRERFPRKLRSRRGETLTETLAAILVIGLVSAGLAAMISAASHMNKEAERLNDALYESVNAAEEKAESAGDIATASVILKLDGAQTGDKLDVTYHGKNPIFSYAYGRTKGAGG